MEHEGNQRTGAEGGPLPAWGEKFRRTALNDKMVMSRMADSQGEEKSNNEKLFIMSWRSIPDVGAFGSQILLPLLGDNCSKENRNRRANES
jgi:hypothetical protein